MIRPSQILVIGEAKACFKFETEFDLKTIFNNQLTADSYKFEVAGTGYQIAKSLADKYQVSLLTEVGQDFLGQEIIHHLNLANLNLDYLRQTERATNCCLQIHNNNSDLISSLDTNRPINLNDLKLKTDLDWLVITNSLDSEGQLNQLLYLTKENQLKTVYFLDQAISKDKLGPLLEDIDLLLVGDHAFDQIASNDDREASLNWLRLKSNSFLINQQTGLLGFSYDVSYQVDQSCANLFQIFLDNYLSTEDFGLALSKTVPDTAKIEESRVL